MRPFFLVPVLLGLLVSPATARAYHTDEDRQTDFSAFTLNRNQFRLGLFQQEYGIFDFWTIGTYTAPWLLTPITGSFNFSLYTKLSLPIGRRWAVSARLTSFYSQIRDLTVGDLEDGDFDATVIPVTVAVSHVLDEKWTFSSEAIWVQSIINADASTAASQDAFGAGAFSNLQFTLTGEYRVSRVFALYLLARYIPLTTAARFKTTLDVSPSVSAELDAEVDSSDLNHSWLLQPGFVASWKTFNIQLGLGYGDLVLPGLRLVGVNKFIVPDFDFYFRF